MTIQVPTGQEAGFKPEEEQKERARLLVLHHAFQVLKSSTEGKRTRELLPPEIPSFPLSLMRRILSQCEHLVQDDRFWFLRCQREAATAPLGGLITAFLRVNGKPMPLESLAVALAAWRSQPPEVLQESIQTFMFSRIGQLFFQTGDDSFGLMDWIPRVEGLTLEEAIAQEFWQREAFAQWLLSFPLPPDPLQGAEALLDAVAMPLSYRELLFALWAHAKEPLDLVALTNQLLKAERLEVLSLGYWVSEKGKKVLTEVLHQMVEEWAQAVLQRARQKDVRRILQTPPSSKEPQFSISERVLDEIAEWLDQRQHPVPVSWIAEQILEVSPVDDDYGAAIRALVRELSRDERFSELGEHCWWRREKIPSGVHEVPSILLPSLTQPTTEGGDVLLPVEALDEDLRRFVEDPRYEDVGEEEAPVPPNLPPPKRLDIPVLFPHLQAGTLRLRRIDRPFFPPEPSIQFLWVMDEAQNEIGIWVNLSLGLFFGLGDWYRQREVSVGGIVRLERTKGGRLRLIWTGRSEPWLHIPPARLQELQQFAAHETVRLAPLITLLQSLLPQHPKGAHFLTLWSELNVLRRVTKVALASLLCAYPMFTRVPNAEGFWTLDFSKIAEGIHPEKLPFLRKMT